MTSRLAAVLVVAALMLVVAIAGTQYINSWYAQHEQVLKTSTNNLLD